MEGTDLLLKTIGLFFVTALAEITGCFLPCLWLRKSGSVWLRSQPCALCLAPDAPSGGEWQGLCSLRRHLCCYRSSLAQGRGRGDVIGARLDGSGHRAARHVHYRAWLAGQAITIRDCKKRLQEASMLMKS